MKNINVFGKTVIFDLLENQPENVMSVAIDIDFPESEKSKLYSLTKKSRIPVHIVSDRTITNLAKTKNHGKIMATITPVKKTNLEEFLKIEKTDSVSIALLCGIQDQHNFGAIIRSATAAGISAIIFPEKNQTKITETTYQTSSGTIGRIPLIEVTNLVQTIKILKNHKFWFFGVEQNGEKKYSEIEYPNLKTCFVIGSEHEGITKLIKEQCDEIIEIPMQNKVESLNVSVACAVVFFEWNKQVNLN